MCLSFPLELSCRRLKFNDFPCPCQIIISDPLVILTLKVIQKAIPHLPDTVVLNQLINFNHMPLKLVKAVASVSGSTFSNFSNVVLVSLWRNLQPRSSGSTRVVAAHISVRLKCVVRCSDFPSPSGMSPCASNQDPSNHWTIQLLILHPALPTDLLLEPSSKSESCLAIS